MICPRSFATATSNTVFARSTRKLPRQVDTSKEDCIGVVRRAKRASRSQNSCGRMPTVSAIFWVLIRVARRRSATIVVSLLPLHVAGVHVDRIGSSADHVDLAPQAADWETMPRRQDLDQMATGGWCDRVRLRRSSMGASARPDSGGVDHYQRAVLNYAEIVGDEFVELGHRDWAR